MLKKLLFLILLSFNFVVYAQAPMMRITRLTMHDGLGSNHVRSIVQDKVGYLWFGTTSGLYRYDGYSVKEIKPRTSEEEKLYDDNRIQDLSVWDGRFIVIRRRGHQFSIYDTQQERFVNFAGGTRYTLSFKDYAIVGNKSLWLKFDNGYLHVSYSGEGSCTVFSTSITRKPVPAVQKAMIARRNAKKTEFARLKSWIKHNLKPYLPAEQDSTILTAFEDKKGNILVGLEDRGIIMAHKIKPLAEYRYYDNNTAEDNRNMIRIVRENANGTLDMIPKYNDISCRMTDRDGHLWEGTRQNGILVDGKRYALPDEGDSDNGVNKVSYILQDRSGRVWITAFTGMFIRADRAANGIIRFNVVRKDLPQLRMAITDHNDNLWICSSEGVYIFNTHTNKFRQMGVGHRNLSVDQTNCIMEDSHNRIWVGTIGFGLVRINNNGSPTVEKVFTSANGLPDNRVESVIEDNNGNIWIGTDYGLAMISGNKCYRFFPGVNDFSMMFMENSVCRMKDGRLAFGSKHGVAIIDPEKTISLMKHSKQNCSSLVLTEVLVNGVDASTLEEAPYDGTTSSLKNITLSHEQNTIRFAVSNFDFYDTDGSSFQFYLEGFDKSWQPLQKENWRLYSNIPSGHYVLHVRTVTSNGQVHKELTIKVVVRSPWWSTWWAVLTYIILVVSIAGAFIYMYYRHWYNRQQLLNKINVEEKLTEYKMLFFTNVSHEFRTPLTIIQGAMESIWNNEKMPSELKLPVSSMKRSSDRLMRLVNQLMDFSKIHDGKLHIRLQDTEVIGFTRDIVDTFKVMASNKNIGLTFLPSVKNFIVPLDRSIIDKMLYNLISNALKYTPSDGEIVVRVENNDGNIIFTISDTGIGIPLKKQEQLFSRFDQSAFINDSIGIGLHMTKDFISAHHGTIEYHDNQPTGSVFTVTLPATADAYSDDEFMQINELMQEAEKNAEKKNVKKIQPFYQNGTSSPLNNKTILVVEDDTDVLEYICSILQSYFHVVTATNGKEALDRMHDVESPVRPDLIITDVMMPVMGGMHFVKNLGTLNEKNTIPIIMLTAVSDEEQQVKAYNLGVDVFIRKPFSPQVLVAQTIQLIQKREVLASKSASAVTSEPKQKKPNLIISPEDQRIRAQFDSWIAENISNPDLTIDIISEHLGVGRTKLYKLMYDITGVTPNEYIRKHRIKRAMELLSDRSLSIQQVAEKAGFDNPNYFSKVFRQCCGMSPMMYRKTGGQADV